MNDYSSLVAHLRELVPLGLKSVMLFGVVKEKDSVGSQACNKDTPVKIVTELLRKEVPTLMLMLDVCHCEYTDHGHCGLLRTVDTEEEEIIDNEKSIESLALIALSYAKSGAHWVCPSDMLDGRVGRIREKLNSNGFSHVGILSYTSKKASVMYDPFRVAVDSTFKGDRKRYQQPIGSTLHALQALKRDESEGASAVLVKPALFYGDLVKTISEKSILPVAAYVVSGDYVMLYDYAKRTKNLEAVVTESHCSLLRAGASVLITYFTPQILKNFK